MRPMPYPDPRYQPPQDYGQAPGPYAGAQPPYPPGWPDGQSPEQDSQPHWDDDTAPQPLYGAPSGQPAPVPPDPAAAPRRRTYLIAGVVAAVVVLGGGAIALAAGGNGGTRTVPLAGATAPHSALPAVPAASAAAPPPAPATPAPHRTIASERALVSWLTRGGLVRLNALGNDFAALQRAGQDNAQPAAVKGACTGLKRDVASAQRYAPIPDRVAEKYWRSALADYASGARDCVNAATALDSQLLLTAGKELQAGTKALQQVSARLKALGQA